MAQYKYLLFDLDGTLSNSQEGIINCMKHALTVMGKPLPPESETYNFIGPPLLDGFRYVCGMDYKDAQKAVLIYRERYGAVGLFENNMYSGIPELLSQLQSEGFTLAVATSKPYPFTLRILENFGILKYFKAVAGCSLEHEGETKADMIRMAMAKLNLTEEDKSHTLMIGDRKHDILGAKECGIKCIGVGYGFAAKGELEEYGADYIFDTVPGLLQGILKINK